jgi:MFS family permease
MSDSHERLGGEVLDLPRPRQQVIRESVSIFAIFFLASAGFANWLARIPAVQERLAMDEARLGLCLLGMSLGSVGVMFLMGGHVSRLGGRRGTWLGYCSFVAALLGPGLAPTALALFLALALMGAGWAILHVSMNTVAHEMEQATGTRILATCHGMFSLGGMMGAVTGSLFARQGTDVTTQFTIVTSVLLVAGVGAARGLYAAPAVTRAVAVRRSLPSRPLLGLCAIVFLILLVEGGIAEWSALLLRDEFAASAATAGLGFATFSLGMALARFGGDRLSRSWGAVRILRAGAALACAGLMFGLAVGQAWLMLASLGLAGLGLANVIPVTLRLAAEHRSRPAAVNVAAVSGVGQLAFLIGPPLLGLLSQVTSLSGAIWMLAASAGLAALIAGPAARATEGERAGGAALRTGSDS